MLSRDIYYKCSALHGCEGECVCVHVCWFMLSNFHLSPPLNIAEEKPSGHFSATFHVFIPAMFCLTHMFRTNDAFIYSLFLNIFFLKK